MSFSPIYVVCDHGYVSHTFHEHLRNRRPRPVILIAATADYIKI
ncbi:hypothetical protein GMO_01410 [Gluconobacter morbifer G707]|uniref:Transposase n=1 Tax=Gluconobacter morbifer G707 TaxID=1088869 RepID=G6XF76_9PROT|nr:hypothetical protein GMO_01410 [Gluconobacter morbifer G707]